MKVLESRPELQVPAEEIDRRFRILRESMAREQLDAILVCGNQYAGFEGAVRYISGFEIVHRYVYALLPLEGDPMLIFPSEARWIGDKKKPWVRQHVWADVPGQWLREYGQTQRWKRVGVHGMSYVMPVRDYSVLHGASFVLVPFDAHFDLARAVKSDWELAAIRRGLDIIFEGFWALVCAYEPGKTEAEIMAPAVERFFARGAGPRMMNIILSGEHGEAEASFKVPGVRRVAADDLLLYSLEIGGLEGYWVEFSRPLIRGALSTRTAEMAAVYPEALEAARRKMSAGEPIAGVHRAAAEVFSRRGFGLGHLSGHSIGLTMLERPAIGSKDRTVLRENMVFSFHPQVVDQDGKVCLYTQDMYRVGKSEGECITPIPWKLYRGQERPED
ncbi:MAG TPA: M24 family metallopeptidase [Candidatus Acidoferrales bacterium]|nr:M24 family metallopeptidase [Candidatus Acidoferrales bacterium]